MTELERLIAEVAAKHNFVSESHPVDVSAGYFGKHITAAEVLDALRELAEKVLEEAERAIESSPAVMVEKNGESEYRTIFVSKAIAAIRRLAVKS